MYEKIVYLVHRIFDYLNFMVYGIRTDKSSDSRTLLPPVDNRNPRYVASLSEKGENVKEEGWDQEDKWGAGTCSHRKKI